MRKILLSLVLAVCLLGVRSSVSLAQYQSVDLPTPTPKVDYSLPFPGILPTHPLYPLKLLRDRVLLLTTRDPMKKSEYLLIFADKNLAMGEIMVQEKKIPEAVEVFKKAEENLLASLDRLEQSKMNGVFPPGPLSKREVSAKKHKEVLEAFLSGDMSVSDQKKLKEALMLNQKAFLKIESLGVPHN